MESTQVAKIHTTMLHAAYHLPYFQIPQPLFDYLRQLPISDTCREVYKLHWSLGAICKNMVSAMAIENVAKRLNVTVRTIQRCYRTLADLGLLIRRSKKNRWGGQAISETILLLPDEHLQELAQAMPRASRRPETTQDAEAADTLKSTAPPLSAAPLTKSPKAVAPSNPNELAAPQITAIQYPEPQTTDPRPRLDDQERRLADPKPIPIPKHQPDPEVERHRITDLIKRLNDEFVAASKARDFKQLSRIGLRIDQLKQQRERLQPSPQRQEDAARPPQTPTRTPTDQPSNPTAQPGATSPPKRRLPDGFKHKIATEVNKITRISCPPQVTAEIIYSLERGAQADRPLPYALNAALKLLRANTWRTPFGFVAPRPRVGRLSEGDEPLVRGGSDNPVIPL